jgi:hypothetical protein
VHQFASSSAVASPSPWTPPDLVRAIQSFETAGREKHLIAILELHPTQMTVGYREVAERRRLRQEALAAGDGLPRLIVPVVLGPFGKNYILDRHHELCFRATEGEVEVRVAVVDDLRSLVWLKFWRELDRRSWCRPQGGDGKWHDYGDIPLSISGLADDPLRSLARAMRRVGGHTKKRTPFNDFLWADFFRQRISRNLVDDDFELALREALELVRNGASVGFTGEERPKIGPGPNTQGRPHLGLV